VDVSRRLIGGADGTRTRKQRLRNQQVTDLPRTENPHSSPETPDAVSRAVTRNNLSFSRRRRRNPVRPFFCVFHAIVNTVSTGW
jgi:hypothetical protein